MFKLSFIFLLSLGLLLARDIHPSYKLKSIGIVSDFVIKENKIYVANDEGIVEIFDLKSKKLLEQIVLEPIESISGELQTPRVLSVDFIDGKVLILSIGKKSYRNLWIYENYQLKNIINESKKLTIKEARFINAEEIFLGTFGSDIALHNIKEESLLYKKHFSQSSLGDFTLSKDKTQVVTSDESGEIQLIDVQSAKTVKKFNTLNVDNVYHVAMAKETIITAGQDRRVGVYAKGEKPYYIKSDFLVYCVGISPSAKYAIYSKSEESHLQVFNVKTRQLTDRLIGHSGIITQIKFLNEKELASCARDNYIFFWRLDK